MLRPKSTSWCYRGPLWTMQVLVHHAELALVLILALVLVLVLALVLALVLMLVLVLVPVPRARPRSSIALWVQQARHVTR